MLSRTAKTVKTAKTVMKATPLKPQPLFSVILIIQSVKVKRGRQKGDGKKNARKFHDKSVPSLQPHFVRGPPPPLPLMSSEVQKRGELAREVRGPEEKTNGRERDALS